MNEPIATSEESGKINVICQESVHRICSGQVVIDLSIAVKELVENSLDSGATCIELKLMNYGKSCITVTDNGCGVLEKDFEGLGLKHHTSKLREFSDLLAIETLGFRGEALSSLCALGELSIITKHVTSERAYELKFDKNGILIEKKPCARQQGTTVNVKDIFKSLPVRAKEFERNIKREFSKMLQVLYSYCLVSTGVKISCTNAVGKKSLNHVLTTNGSNDVLDNITSIFGRKARENLIEVDLLTPNIETLEEYNIDKNATINFNWKCFVSSCSHNLGRSTSDRQFFFVNDRPCDPHKISKLINQIYHKYNNKQYPFVFLNVKMQANCADVNITPDKRTILFTQEGLILAVIKFNLDRVWNDNQGKFTIKTLEELNFTIKKRSLDDSYENGSKRQKVEFESTNGKTQVNHIELIKKNLKSKTKPNFLNNYNFHKTEESSPNTNIIYVQNEYPGRKTVSINNIHSSRVNSSTSINQLSINKLRVQQTNEYKIECSEYNEIRSEREYIENSNLDYNLPNDDNDDDDDDNASERINSDDFFQTKVHITELEINLSSVKEKYSLLDKVKRTLKDQRKMKFRTTLTSKSAEVESELERELSKDSFKEMEVVGQFNLGFILSKWGDDLFIVDQHATDEKYRFEKLSKETKLKTQKLLIPRNLELSCLSETILMENQNVFLNNGFTFVIDDKAESGCKVKLSGMPVSFDWQFGHEDIEEIIFLIRECIGNKEIIRPTRVRQMLASRACRSAVMIGTALNKNHMKMLLNQMSEMINPWNCPHGRPTVRHLVSLSMI